MPLPQPGRRPAGSGQPSQPTDQRRAHPHPANRWTRRRRARPASVWPLAQDSRPGALTDPATLSNAIAQIVTTYTVPGDRVLLLAAPVPSAPAVGARRTAPAGQESVTGPVPGLLDAAWTVVRLGRIVESRTAAAVSHADAAYTDSPDGPESAPRLIHQSAAPAPTGPGPAPCADRPTEWGPNCFDVAITAIEPDATDWAGAVPWDALLTPSGLLAVITHGDYVGGRWVDPCSAVRRIADRAGLAEIDRIALLEVPIRDGALDVPVATRAARPLTASAGLPRHARVHSDLLIFTRPRGEERQRQGVGR